MVELLLVVHVGLIYFIEDIFNMILDGYGGCDINSRRRRGSVKINFVFFDDENLSKMIKTKTDKYNYAIKYKLYK